MQLYRRALEKGDAELANHWLEGWGLQPLPLTMYPDTGVVLCNEEQPVFIGFIWVSNSKMMQIGFITRNPFVRKLPKNTRKNFLQELIVECRKMGAEHIITWTDNPILVQDFRDRGFTQTSDKCRELIIYQLKD